MKHKIKLLWNFVRPLLKRETTFVLAGWEILSLGVLFLIWSLLLLL